MKLIQKEAWLKPGLTQILAIYTAIFLVGWLIMGLYWQISRPDVSVWRYHLQVFVLGIAMLGSALLLLPWIFQRYQKEHEKQLDDLRIALQSEPSQYHDLVCPEQASESLRKLYAQLNETRFKLRDLKEIREDFLEQLQHRVELQTSEYREVCEELIDQDNRKARTRLLSNRMLQGILSRMKVALENQPDTDSQDSTSFTTLQAQLDEGIELLESYSDLVVYSNNWWEPDRDGVDLFQLIKTLYKQTVAVEEPGVRLELKEPEQKPVLVVADRDKLNVVIKRVLRSVAGAIDGHLEGEFLASTKLKGFRLRFKSKSSHFEWFGRSWPEMELTAEQKLCPWNWWSCVLANEWIHLMGGTLTCSAEASGYYQLELQLPASDFRTN